MHGPSHALEHRLASLVEVTHALVAADSPDAILNRVVDTAIDLVHADSGFLMLFREQSAEKPVASRRERNGESDGTEDEPNLLFREQSPEPGAHPDFPPSRLEVRVARNFDRETIATDAFAFSRGVIERALATRSPVLVDDAQRELGLAERESVMRYNLRAALVAPLVARGHLIGLIYLDNRLLSNAFTVDDLTIVTALANIAATLLERARSFTVIESLNAELRTRLATISEQAEKLRQAEKLAAVGRLAAGVAHEINNPLSVIQGSIEILLPRATSPDVREDLLAMKREVHQIAHIVAALLDYSRPRRLNREAIDIATFLAALAVPGRFGLDATSLRVDSPKELFVAIDAGAVRQVVDNLLKNAVDAVLGAPIVRVDARALDYQGARDAAQAIAAPRRQVVLEELALAAEWILVTVSDNGAGIEPQNLERIFEPFFTTKVVGRGTGLGLAIAREIVRAHGGLLEVVSRVGEGSTFMIFFRAHEANAR